MADETGDRSTQVHSLSYLQLKSRVTGHRVTRLRRSCTFFRVNDVPSNMRFRNKIRPRIRLPLHAITKLILIRSEV